MEVSHIIVSKMTIFMLKITKLALLTVVIATVVLTSCRRDRDNLETYKSMFGLHSDDNARVSNELDLVASDASNTISAAPIMSGGKIDGLGDLCDAIVTYDTLGDNRQVTINYNGTNCQGNRSRVGTVIITIPLGTLWNQAGSIATVTINNLKITRLSDNKSITLNGIKTITNVSGGLVQNLSSLSSITHTVSSTNMSIAFDDGTQRLWNIARQRVFTYNNGIVLTITGTHSENGVVGIAEWGITRNGSEFIAQITQPLVIRQDCDFRLTSGQKVFTRLEKTVTVSFGLDGDGNPTTCPGSGNYYLKAEWTNAQGEIQSVIKPY